MTTILVSTKMFSRVLSSLVTSDMRFGGCVVEQRGKSINIYHVWYRLIFYTTCGIVLLLELRKNWILASPFGDNGSNFMPIVELDFSLIKY
mgnify:CR=1 FL=1